jgi:hypothetical protein
MPDQPVRPRDLNELAAQVVAEAVGDAEPPKPSPAAEYGRLGGLKGGPARAAKLSADERSEIARKASRARWSNSN